MSLNLTLSLSLSRLSLCKARRGGARHVDAGSGEASRGESTAMTVKGRLIGACKARLGKARRRVSRPGRAEATASRAPRLNASGGGEARRGDEKIGNKKRVYYVNY